MFVTVFPIQFLASFLSWLSHSREFWAALIGVIGAFIGAVIGGRIAGHFALRAQKQAAKDQRERDRETERQAVIGTLKAIQAELTYLKTGCFDPLHKRLEQRPPGVFHTTHVDQNYFTVFESNAGLFGRIDDEQLLKKIVSVYGQSKGLVDAMNFNFRRFEYSNSIALQEGPQSPKIPLLHKELSDLANGLQNGVNRLLPEVTELLERISKYLVSNEKKSA